MKPSERLSKVIEFSGLSAAELAKKIGVNPQNFYDVLKDRTKGLSENIRTRIKSYYPEINEQWLITGRGDMVLAHPQVLSGGNYNIQAVNSHVSQINGPSTMPNTPIEDAQAVCLETGAVEGETVEFLPVIPAKLAQSAEEDTWVSIQQNPVPRQPVVMQFPEYHTSLQVRSDAMAPRLRSGDYVALRHMGKNPKVMNGEVYCFDTRDSGLVIREGTNIPGGYRLHARSERYADDVLMYEEVLNVYEVVGAVIMNI